MARFMLTRVETYRVDTEAEVKEFIDDVKNESITDGYTLKSYSSTFKEKKQKGEVIDSAFEVKIAKVFDTMWDI